MKLTTEQIETIVRQAKRDAGDNEELENLESYAAQEAASFILREIALGKWIEDGNIANDFSFSRFSGYCDVSKNGEDFQVDMFCCKPFFTESEVRMVSSDIADSIAEAFPEILALIGK